MMYKQYYVFLIDLAHKMPKSSAYFYDFIHFTEEGAEMVAEIMFIESFYQSQTLSVQKLKESSYTDPYPERDIFALIPDLIQYYVTRWEQMNLIPPINKCFFDPEKLADDFLAEPQRLLSSILDKKIDPFSNFEKP